MDSVNSTIGRTLVAVAGAVIITITLLLAMNAVTQVFREDSGERYYRIGDVLLLPRSDRPIRPRRAEPAPEITEPRFEDPDLDVTIETEAPEAPRGQVPRDLLAPEDFESRAPSPPASTDGGGQPDQRPIE